MIFLYHLEKVRTALSEMRSKRGAIAISELEIDDKTANYICVSNVEAAANKLA